MKPIKNVTIGADPEMFIFDTKEKKVISSIGIIPGEKGDAWRDDSWPEGFGLEIDNILAEFNIPPVTTKKEFINNMNFMKNYIREFVKKVNPNFDILCTASKIVDEDQLQSKEAKLFGCSVDYNAYTQGPNPKPQGETTNLRSAGCHLHLGYDSPDTERSVEMIKMMDIFLGLPSVIIDRDRKRRSLYGKAGCFRLTGYGLEYRVLSAKMYDTDELMSLVWDGVEAAITSFNRGFIFDKEFSVDVVKAINKSDSRLAKKVLNKILSLHIHEGVDEYIKTIISI